MARTVIVSGSGQWVTLLRFEWEWASSLKDIGRTVIREYDTINAEKMPDSSSLFVRPILLRISSTLFLTEQAIIVGHLEKPRRLHFLFLKTLVYCSIWVFCEHIKYKKQTISFGPDLISRQELPNMRFFEVPRSELVKDWAYVMNIELHYLPPYSPNLNPIERLWKLMNGHLEKLEIFNGSPACL